MKKVFDHWKSYIFRGMLAIIPIYLSYQAIKIAYYLVDKPVTNIVFEYTGYKVYGLGVVCVIVILYFCGLVSSNLIGRKFFRLIEEVSNRIPLVKTVYQVGKQVAETFSLSEKQVFQKSIFIRLSTGFLTLGFVTGEIEDIKNGIKYYKVMVPTVPNPTTGFIIILEKSQAIDTGWSIEESVKTVVSGGIIGPSQFFISQEQNGKNSM